MTYKKVTLDQKFISTQHMVDDDPDDVYRNGSKVLLRIGRKAKERLVRARRCTLTMPVEAVCVGGGAGALLK